MLNNIARDEDCRAGAVCQYENLLELLSTRGDLRSFTIVTFQDAAEFASATDNALGLWAYGQNIQPTCKLRDSLLMR